jgi:hypothetical protein
MQYNLEVNSSLVKSANWDDISENITVTFHNGHKYTYPNFTYDDYQSFSTATSKGQWFGKNLKNREYSIHIKPEVVE